MSSSNIFCKTATAAYYLYYIIIPNLHYKYNINQTATAVGYDNAHYISRLFKKHSGPTPSKYRTRTS
ncbi:MAG: AraC family transcriptional regulator [Oscillospiraceae bacterium]|nr:AraC family transcriptional regulator [Oscillospiraceae bacterium]